MGLPNAREALPNGPGSIIPSSTILAIEDCVIAINRLLTGQAQGVFSTNVTLLGTLTVGGGRVAFNATTPASMTLSGALATVSVPGGGDTGPILNPDGISGVSFIKAAGGATVGKGYHHLPPLPAGTHLQSWSIRISKGTNSSNPLTAKLLRVLGGIQNQVGSTQTVTAGTSIGDNNGGAGLDHPIVAGSAYFVEVGSPGSGAGSGTDQTFEMTITFT